MKKIMHTLSAVVICFCIAVIVARVGESSQSGEGSDARIEKILGQMTLDEKIDYIGGLEGPKGANMYIRAVPRLDLPGFKMSDGPLGVRTWGPSMAYPAGISMAATWDTALEHDAGVGVGAIPDEVAQTPQLGGVAGVGGCF